MISFIIPAHNEETHLPSTLVAIRRAAQELNQPAEIIVVNDDSSDLTELIALQHGAIVLNVQHRHIAATRNSGGLAAKGDVLFFVDADTQISTEAVKAGLKALRRGAAGGGFLVELSGFVPWWAKLALPLAVAVSRRLKICGGACLFCPKETFARVGGFDESYFAAEDVAFVRDVKRLGKFVIPRELVTTSARKFKTMSFWRILPLFLRLASTGPASFRSKQGLEHWYSQAVR
jgi:glycosyltransferase involved in cell wall biosynthesis